MIMNSISWVKVVTVLMSVLWCNLGHATTAKIAKLVIDPHAANSVYFDKKIPEGSKLELNYSGLEKGQVLRLHTCDKQCMTAKEVKTFSLVKDNANGSASISLTEGHYYIWLEDSTKILEAYGNPIKVSKVSPSNSAKNTSNVVFTSGLELTISLTQ